MDAQDFRSLQEAYLEVVENQQLDEISTELAKRAGEERMNRTFALMQKDWKEGKKKPSSEFQKSYKKQQDGEKRYRKKLQQEQVDLYDIILSHLLDEGYAETQEQAEVIMVNMSEDWRESIILEQTLPSNYTDYKASAVQTAHARSMGSASRMRQMGMNATAVDPKDDAQSNLNAVKSGSGVAKPLSGTIIRSGAGKGFKVGDPGINIGSSK